MAEASEGELACGCGEKQLLTIDALIVTGAPLEQMSFEEVRYWKELQDIWDWTAHCGIPTLNICWAAQAALHHFYGWGKRGLAEKMFWHFRAVQSCSATSFAPRTWRKISHAT